MGSNPIQDNKTNFVAITSYKVFLIFNDLLFTKSFKIILF